MHAAAQPGKPHRFNLPCFPDIVPRVRRALDDPTTSTDDLVRIAHAEHTIGALRESPSS